MTCSFTRVLLATEHTEFDTGAERLAFELAKECGIPLMGVLPMVSNVEDETVTPRLVAQAEEEAFAKLTQLRAAANAAAIDLDIRVRRGEEPSREIIAEAQRCHADLVVARRRGKRGFLGQLMVGEMVGKVATRAPCSVLLVPRAGRMWSQYELAAADAAPTALRAVGTAAQHKLPCAGASCATSCGAACSLTLTRVRCKHGITAGGSVDAAVRTEGADRPGLERRRRYCTGPPFVDNDFIFWRRSFKIEVRRMHRLCCPS